jgi:hypothetical protein
VRVELDGLLRLGGCLVEDVLDLVHVNVLLRYHRIMIVMCENR